MSIDNLFDSWAEENGIRRRADVVADHACQVFDADAARDEFDTAMETIRTLLIQPKNN